MFQNVSGTFDFCRLFHISQLPSSSTHKLLNIFTSTENVVHQRYMAQISTLFPKNACCLEVFMI